MPAEPSHEVRASREEGRTNPVPAKSTKALSTCSRLQRCGTSLDFRSSGGAYCSGALLRYVRATLSLRRDVRWCVVNCARVRAGKTSAQPSVWTSGDSKQRWLCDSATAVTTTLCLYTLFSKCRECALVALFGSETQRHRVSVRASRPLWCGVCVHSVKGVPWWFYC